MKDGTRQVNLDYLIDNRKLDNKLMWRKKKMIEGVVITKLKKIPDERGSIYHMLRKDDKHFIEFGEIYFSLAYPGVVKGWHEHTKQTQNYAVIDGMIKLVLFDNRENSNTYKIIQEIFIGDLIIVWLQYPLELSWVINA